MINSLFSHKRFYLDAQLDFNLVLLIQVKFILIIIFYIRTCNIDETIQDIMLIIIDY